VRVRRKSRAAEPPATPPSGPGKNRPTPKRREAEAARRQPLVPSGRASGGKGQTKATREAARQERMHARERMMAGDERYLAARDRGPVKRFVRDAVDARWNLGEFVLPVMLLVLVLSWVGTSVQRNNPQAYTLIFAVTYVVIVASALDAYLLTRRLRRDATARFGPAAWERGTGMYAAMRAFQIRRTRVPKPQVPRGRRTS
jgi:Protein of unknown function (DUF3043)